MAEEVIVANALCVKFNDRTVLDQINLSVDKGEVFTLLGGNGAGKSTTLKTFLGAVKPSSGQATVLGHSLLDENSTIRSKVAYLPESVMLYGHLTGVENIEYFLSLAGLKKNPAKIEAALKKVALQTNAWDQHLSTYSKGMRQKAAIALAMLREAPILFLDEPTSGLDPSAIDEFNQLITQLSNAGTTIFMVTHDVYGACQVAHRVGLLDKGKLVGMFKRENGQKIDTEMVHAMFVKRNSA